MNGIKCAPEAGKVFELTLPINYETEVLTPDVDQNVSCRSY